MEEFGLPEMEEYGVLDCSLSGQAVYATMVRSGQQTVSRLDRKAKGVTPALVERVVVYPFGVYAAREALEVYAGPAGARR